MKFIGLTTFVFGAILAAPALGEPVATYSELEAECGTLGIMKVGDDLLQSKGVDRSNVRKCAGHPEGRDRGDPESGSWAPVNAVADKGSNFTGSAGGIDKEADSSQVTGTVLESRACSFGAPYGCSKKGRCWKTCGPASSGEWCWTAKDGGIGDWITCSTWQDCNTDQACGAGDCKECGCSC